MKRSNFTFLFLFALLSFVSINLGAQGTSSSCVDRINIAVDGMCGWVINADVLGATGPAVMASTGSGSLFFTGDASGGGNFSPMFPHLTGSLTGIPGAAYGPLGHSSGPRLPYGGLAGYELWSGPNRTGQMLCWGEINFEIKRTPPTITRRWDFMCSQPYPAGFPTLKSIIATANGECSAHIENITEYESVSGNVCDEGFLTIRKVTGTVDIDGNKVPVILRIDSIYETPLDTGMVECPIGGPDFEDAQHLDCDLLSDLGFGIAPTADEVYAYWVYYYRFIVGYPKSVAESLAVPYAYPYIEKGYGIYSHEICNDVIIKPERDSSVLIDGYWVDVTLHAVYGEVCYDDYDSYPIYLPLPKTTTCNLSVKCDDWYFPGCAGPETKTLRKWSILDWCNGSIKECVQWIVVDAGNHAFVKVLGKDTRPSKINKPGGFYHMYPKGTVYVDIAPWICSATLPLTAMVDWSCGGSGEIHWATTFGYIDGDNILRGLWLGETAHVTATAISDCDHDDFVKFNFYVVPIDNILPVPIAEDKVNLTLTGDPTGAVSPDGGVGKVFVDAIDAGSHNAGCGEVDLCLLRKDELADPVIIGGKHYEVGHKNQYGVTIYHKIYYSHGCVADGILPGQPATKLQPAIPDIPYVYCKEYVKFCCSDIGEVPVALLATNSGGRTAHSWSIVNVEDKTSPVVICRNGEIDCTDDFDPYDYHPIIQSGICSDITLTPTYVEDLDVCGRGYYEITWRNSDDEVVCTSTVYVYGEDLFDPYEIKWPKHYTGDYEDGVIRECEVYRGSNGKPILKNGDVQKRIVEYYGQVAMGPAFECEEG